MDPRRCSAIWLVLPAMLWQVIGSDGRAAEKTPLVYRCPVEPAPGVVIRFAPAGGCGGGMAGDGWDGGGQNAATLYWHVGGTTPDLGDGQRAALIQALQAWAAVVQINFVELPVANWSRSIDFYFFSGDHSAFAPHEAGDADCPFDGPGGTLAHAGYPPGIDQLCSGNSGEYFSGNVHFDEAELWEQDAGSATAISLTLVACHEIGHSLGLTHSDCPADVMRPAFNAANGFLGLSGTDIANVRSGYAAGSGTVFTLNDTGVWVDRNYAGIEAGTQSLPFNKLIEGVTGVPPFSSGVVVHLQAGSYPEPMVIAQSMILQAENGPVIIGR
jgi:hypothetical protein